MPRLRVLYYRRTLPSTVEEAGAHELELPDDDEENGGGLVTLKARVASLTVRNVRV